MAVTECQLHFFKTVFVKVCENHVELSMEFRRSKNGRLTISWSAFDLAMFFSGSLQVEVTPIDYCYVV